MFVRFRQSNSRLQVSLIATHRVDGKVRHEHIAGLGSISLTLTVFERFEFWQRLHERLARLSNRVDAGNQAKLLGDVHARIPMVTPDEQRALQRENAEADAGFWEFMQQYNDELASGYKHLSATTHKAIASAEAGAQNASENATAAQARLRALERGGYGARRSS